MQVAWGGVDPLLDGKVLNYLLHIESLSVTQKEGVYFKKHVLKYIATFVFDKDLRQSTVIYWSGTSISLIWIVYQTTSWLMTMAE